MATLHGMVMEQAGRTPDAVAVIHDDGDAGGSVTITYTEMWLRASQVLEDFQRHGIHHETVGICLEPGINLPTVLLGILRSSSSFLPLALDGFGFARQTLTRLAVRHLVIGVAFSQRVPSLLQGLDFSLVPSVTLLTLGVCLVRLHPSVAKQPRLTTSPHPAYCITTSGTTGSPKVVRVPHTCIAPNITDLRKEFRLTVGDVVFLTSPLTFDPSIVDIFMTLTSGAALLLVPSAVKMSPSRLLNFLTCRHKVTILQMTPSMLHRFDPGVVRQRLLGADSCLRVLCLGGETFPAGGAVRDLFHLDNRTAIYNLYGITEVSCWATLHCARKPRGPVEDDVPIGAPLTGTKVKVQDEQGNLVSNGVGHIWIGGDERKCLLDDEDGGTLDSEWVWRPTGDIGRVKDGRVVCLGRHDRQVKRYGKRLDLDTVEKVALGTEGVANCRAILRKNQLLLFVTIATTTGGGSRDLEMLVEGVGTRLRNTVPAHYLPNFVTALPCFPVNAHGKLDESALLAAYDKDRSQEELQPTPLNTWFCSQWQDATGQKSVAPSDGFLACGGDSLKAVDLVQKVEVRLGEPVPDLLDALLTKPLTELLTLLSRSRSQQEKTFGSRTQQNNLSQLVTTTAKAAEVVTKTTGATEVVTMATEATEVVTIDAEKTTPRAGESHAIAEEPRGETRKRRCTCEGGEFRSLEKRKKQALNHPGNSSLTDSNPKEKKSSPSESTLDSNRSEGGEGGRVDPPSAVVQGENCMVAVTSDIDANGIHAVRHEAHCSLCSVGDKANGVQHPQGDLTQEEDTLCTSGQKTDEGIGMEGFQEKADGVGSMGEFHNRMEKSFSTQELQDRTEHFMSTEESNATQEFQNETEKRVFTQVFQKRIKESIAAHDFHNRTEESVSTQDNQNRTGESISTHEFEDIREEISAQGFQDSADTTSHKQNTCDHSDGDDHFEMQSFVASVGRANSSLQVSGLGFTGGLKANSCLADSCPGCHSHIPACDCGELRRLCEGGDTVGSSDSESDSEQDTKNGGGSCFRGETGGAAKSKSRREEGSHLRVCGCVGGKTDGLKHEPRKTEDSNPVYGDCEGAESGEQGEGRVEATPAWSVDTGKCVDASPLVAETRCGRQVVFIGSHSHRFLAIDLEDGRVVWSTRLGDRVEGSAALSPCGQWVIVGCYDYQIYVLAADSGQVWWQMKTGGEVKCTPVADSPSRLVLCGSHDGFVYALHCQERAVRWKRHLGGGAIFASPAVSDDSSTVFAATTAGNVAAFSLVCGRLLWKVGVSKPVFSSPAVQDGRLYVGCVDSSLYCLSTVTGQQIWVFKTGAPIFSPVLIAPNNKYCQGQILFGCHDSHLYCISSAGKLVWKHKTTSTVYAAPFICCHGNNQSLQRDRRKRGLKLSRRKNGKCFNNCILSTKQNVDNLSSAIFDSGGMRKTDDLPSIFCDSGEKQNVKDSNIICDCGGKQNVEDLSSVIFHSAECCRVCGRGGTEGRDLACCREGDGKDLHKNMVRNHNGGSGARKRGQHVMRNHKETNVQRDCCSALSQLVDQDKGVDQIMAFSSTETSIQRELCSTCQVGAREDTKIARREPCCKCWHENGGDGRGRGIHVCGQKGAGTTGPVGDLVILASTDGRVEILSLATGHCLGSLLLPGDVFSSPVVVKGNLMVGCRDDKVYCHRLSPVCDTL